MNRTRRMKTITQDQPRLQPWMLPETGSNRPTRNWSTSPDEVESLAMDFEPISLKQMDAVALLNRTDTKFVMSTRQLLGVLAIVREDYWMLSVTRSAIEPLPFAVF